MLPSHKILALCLALMAAALIAVGFLSSTLARHAIQVVPILAAVVALVRRPAWGAWPAIPIFGFWLVIMVLIWLYLLGFARVVTGTFSTGEVALTVVVGAAAAVGLMRSLRTPSVARMTVRAWMFTLFAAFQACAMWYSYAGPFASPTPSG